MKKITYMFLLLPIFAIAQTIPMFPSVSNESLTITTANATATSVEFFWNPVNDAATYGISYDSDSGQRVTGLSVGSQLRHPVYGLRPGTKIRFTVTPFTITGQALPSGGVDYRLLGGADCSSSVVPPAVLNGINVTATFTGGVNTYPTDYTSCGSVTTPINSLWLGFAGSYVYTMNFSEPVNNLVIALTATGNTQNEIFVFTTNGGTPTIATTISCFTTVTGNEIASGLGSGSSGGGGIFTIQAPSNFTSLTITGPGGDAGSLLSICSNSVAPVTCTVSFAPVLSTTTLTAICPATTVNLNAIAASNLPVTTGVAMTWHSAIPVTQANQLTGNLANQPAGLIYYAAFYDSINDCYGAPTAVTTATSAVTPNFNQVTPICSNQVLSPLPTTSLNGIAGTWSPAINSSATTTYTFTPTNAGCATNATMTIQVTPTVVPVFNAVPAVCSGEFIAALPLVSNNAIAGIWTPAVNNTATTMYTFTPNAGQCADNATLEIVINPIPVVSVTQGCVGQNYVLTATSNTEATYEWRDGNGIQIGSEASVTIVAPGTYSVNANANGCETDTPVVVTSVGCTIQKGISPNGDAMNDFFDLTNLDVANLKIFNRYGMLVYNKSNYTNQWKGKSDSGNELPDATYYYVIQLNDGKSKTGWVYVNSKS